MRARYAAFLLSTFRVVAPSSRSYFMLVQPCYSCLYSHCGTKYAGSKSHFDVVTRVCSTISLPTMLVACTSSFHLSLASRGIGQPCTTRPFTCTTSSTPPLGRQMELPTDHYSVIKL
eukprot:1993361-Amphidinium_carterae.1